ncbi:hypothetical protein THTE_1515 [Thermogutta terrifontis]|uniref:Uncharacterized protein n=1 Tax=Thermogutta terrifontis TaxID=1331910 RepID=A0A286RDU8_9BACT|nr:hypothetical protein THTE_1515 [Thermogutta terrifontis]
MSGPFLPSWIIDFVFVLAGTTSVPLRVRRSPEDWRTK